MSIQDQAWTFLRTGSSQGLTQHQIMSRMKSSEWWQRWHGKSLTDSGWPMLCRLLRAVPGVALGVGINPVDGESWEDRAGGFRAAGQRVAYISPTHTVQTSAQTPVQTQGERGWGAQLWSGQP